jgi:hypothetical protein
LELLGPTLLLPVVLVGAAPIFIYLYAILRWRSGGIGEPGIGSYGLVLYFRTAALLLGVGAVSLLVYILLSAEEHDDMERVCWGILVASVVILGIHVPLGAMLRPEGDCHAATRLFGGGLMGIAGLVVFVALVLFMVTLFEDYRNEEQHIDQLKAFSSWAVCFGLLYFLTARNMARDVRHI